MVGRIIQTRVFVAGVAEGEILRLSEPLSLWGGLNPDTGEITDQHHPDSGKNVTGHILVMSMGRGSSSASSVLLEAVRQKTAPSSIILAEMDGILVLGAVVAREIYEIDLPVLVVNPDDYDLLQSGQHARILEDGRIILQ
jgi:predicted aconitase with swiveling domain